MLENRALEIISSARFVEVTFNGQPVWIESVNRNTELATVMPCGTDEKIDVPLAQLVEENYQ
ncbi:Small, acid-soluble spore protein H [bioreactor metagenome]|uniref:Small, acid-soluble spore protein H n=1 Tax=bioreactor metagenome TaxID=1076179 RepID=A0A644TGJ8_9ZZZZ|nr:H-type small acid-soluble spore protein [Negativicutes bacterium]